LPPWPGGALAQVSDGGGGGASFECPTRVLAPGAPLSISTLNYNLVFRAWNALGTRPGAWPGPWARSVGAGAATRLLAVLNERGYKLDHYLQRTAVAGMVGFFWLAKAVNRRHVPGE